MSNEPLSEQLHKAWISWADKHAAAEYLEKMKDTVFSQMMLDLKDLPVNRAEIQVKASERWEEYMERMVRARYEANIEKAHLEYIQVRVKEWMNEEANHRAQSRLA